MSAEELARGLTAIEGDEDVRGRVAAGELAAAGDLDLTDEEKSLLQGAADDYPEVAGFSFSFGMLLPAVQDGPQTHPGATPGILAVHDYLGSTGFKFQKARNDPGGPGAFKF
jgi:hypothetical protein